MNEKIKIHVDTRKCAQCLMCQLMCSFTHTKSFNISKSRINVDIAKRAIDFSEKCNNCGVCARFCAYGALVIECQRRLTDNEGI